jgi:CBS domain-containing membrane protein
MTSTIPLQDRTVGQVMNRELLTVTPDDSLLMAWELMRRGHFHHLPVVTEDGRLLGVLDTETIATHWNAGSPNSNCGPVSALLDSDQDVSVTPDDPVRAVATIMMRRHTDFVAVTESDGMLDGLVTTRDLIAIIAGDEPHETKQPCNTPSLYRIEPVMPRWHPGESRLPPE